MKAYTKVANDMYQKLVNTDSVTFKNAFQNDIGDAIKMIVREESLANKIISMEEINQNDDHLQKADTHDRPVYVKNIERGAIAMNVGFRDVVDPYYETNLRFKTQFEKYTTGKVAKPRIELLMNNGFVEMIRENGINEIARRYDARFFSAALLATCYTSWPSAHSANEEWQSTFDRKDISSMKSRIMGQELIPAKFAGSSTYWEFLNTLDAADIGDDAYNTLKNGFGDNKLLELPFHKTIRADLTANESIVKYTGTASLAVTDYIISGAEIVTLLGLGIISVGDIITTVGGVSGTVTALNTIISVTVDTELTSSLLGWTLESNGKLFRYTVGTGIYERVYCFADEDYLGINKQLLGFESTTEWKGDIFEWETYCYKGFGFGDIRGITSTTFRVE